MSIAFAGNELLNMAIQLEKKGKAFYDSVANTVKDNETREIFRYLADEEVRHEELFTEMLRKTELAGSTPYDDSEMLSYFRALVDREIFPDEAYSEQLKNSTDDPSTAIRIALSLEKDAVLYFHELASRTEAEDRKIIEAIIAEERKHIQRILQLKQKMGV